MLSKRKIKQMLSQLSNDEKNEMLRELLESIATLRKSGDSAPLLMCVDAWEATAEMKAIPGASERVWGRFNRLKDSGAIHG
jgi:hypothetical protein